jgi:dihydrofolate reductase
MLLPCKVLAGKNYEIILKSGVTSEVIDYEGDLAKTVIRGGASVLLSDTFIFNFTYLRNIDDDLFTYTWNLSAKEIAGFLNVTAGNYNLHFGSGLMMGRKTYTSSDPFSKKISVAKDKTVSLSNNGNPEYSLYGTVAEFYKNFDEAKIYLLTFFSDQRRFITSEAFEAGAIESSLFTLNTKVTKKGKNTEPVNIINYGGVLGLDSSLFNFQFYYFETDLKGDSGKDILWDKKKYFAPEGVDLIKNSGLFAEYRDNNLSFFIEPALSTIISNTTVTDYAIAWGVGVKNSIMNLSMRGKNCGLYFHSEYSSGNRMPEDVWELKCGIYPINPFEIGCVVYSEKNITPAYNRNYIEGAIHEEFYAKAKFKNIKINSNFKRVEHYSDDREESADQVNLASELNVSKNLFFKLRSTAQKKQDDISYLYGGEVRTMFFNHFHLYLGYTKIEVNGATPIYAVITPASEHSLITRFKDSGHGGSIYFRYKKNKDSFYIRFTAIKTETMNKNSVESALVLVF